MANQWTLATLLYGLHNDIQQRLQTAREAFGHPGTKGDASEAIWLQMLQKYLPERYRAEKAHVVDSKGKFSQQMDVVIFDRQYTPFIFNFEGQLVVPAEGVYAVFEAKQAINAENVKYAKEKIESVRTLHRTSLPIPHAGGTFPAKPPIKIISGILTLESDWSPGMGEALKNALTTGGGTLDIGCIAAHGYFLHNSATNDYEFHTGGKPATSFLFKLISMLQFSGTVPMIDLQEYAKWLAPENGTVNT